MRSSCSRTSVRLDDSVLMPTVSPSVSLPVAKGSTGTVSSSSSKAQEFDVLSLQLSHFGNRSVNKFDQLLHEAVIKNDAQRVQTLLAAGVSTNSTIHLDRTPLHWAAMHGHTDMIRYLLEHKCAIEPEDKLGMTPLLVAAWYGHAETVQYLLDCGANGCQVDKKGQTLLHCACRNDHLDVIRLLLSQRVGLLQLNQVDKAGQTALHLAVLNDDVDAVKELLDAGAQPHVKDKHHERNALHWAAVKGYDEVLEKLLQQSTTPLNEQEAQCHTALHLAAEFSHRRCVRLLLRYNSNAFVADDKGRTALHLAASLGYSGVVQQLCAHHPDLVLLHDRKGNGALHLAVMGNHQQTVQALLQAGAPINSTNLREQTALHLAAELGFIESAEVLLNNGADLSLCERSGRSALYVAARGSYPALVDLLIRAQRVRQHRAGSVVSLQSTGFASRKCSLERNTSLDSTDTHRTYLANEPETDRVLSRQPSQQSNAGNELLLDLSLQPNSTVLTTTTATTAQQEEATVQPILTQQLLIKQQVLWQQQQFNQSKQMRDMLNTVARQYLDNDDWKRLARHWQFPDEHIRAIEHQYTGRSSFKEHGHRLLLIWLHSLPPHQHALRELLLALRCIQRSDLADRVRKRLADDSLLLPATTHSLTRSTSDGLHSATGSYAEESVRPDARFGLSHLLSSELSDSLKVGRALNRLLASLLNVRRRRRCDCLPADQEACGYCCIS